MLYFKSSKALSKTVSVLVSGISESTFNCLPVLSILFSPFPTDELSAVHPPLFTHFFNLTLNPPVSDFTV